jgi:maltooligosyltrehalose trehalohydrolase
MQLAASPCPPLRGVWRPSLGAVPFGDRARFRVWAPDAHRVEVVVEPSGEPSVVVGLRKRPDGIFECCADEVRAGDRYRYRVDGRGPFPDPASRFQPEGVHGPSEVVDPGQFAWTDSAWPGVDQRDLILYELHVGTFTPEGTFEWAARQLGVLRELGVSAIELMPIANFAGRRNWGYDGVNLFAPARCYGAPDDLRRFVDAAHGLGIAVFLDVVYNHFGPVGNYALEFSSHYLSHRTSAWAACVNLDGEKSEMVSEFFIENALHWIHEYHIDGLRLDATHALHDDKRPHFVERLAARVHSALPGRRIPLIAEDYRNLDGIIRPRWAGGWDLDGVWADDFHHQLRRHLAGDAEGYFRDYTGTTEDVAETINQGWFYTGQYSIHMDRVRGSDPVGIPASRFVIALQNHDQIGNRPFAERLNHQIAPAAYRAASALFLCAPQTPLLFMGQEWAASTPFYYFTDHDEDLGKIVTEGRRREFRHFLAFIEPQNRDKIADPQDLSTFESSVLNWEETAREPHAATLRLYRDLIRLRRSEPALRSDCRDDYEAVALDGETLLLVRSGPTYGRIAVVTRFEGAAELDLKDQEGIELPEGMRWQLLLTTEDEPYAPRSNPPFVDLVGDVPKVEFSGPASVILKAVRAC